MDIFHGAHEGETSPLYTIFTVLWYKTPKKMYHRVDHKMYLKTLWYKILKKMYHSMNHKTNHRPYHRVNHKAYLLINIKIGRAHV